MQSDSRRNMRKQFFDEVERMYQVNKDPKDDVFYYHPNCNILFNALPYQLGHDKREGKAVKASNRLIAIAVVASGYGGDMDEDLADELLDDMDFFFNKVCCRKIERMILHLNKLVEEELCRFSLGASWGLYSD